MQPRIHFILAVSTCLAGCTADLGRSADGTGDNAAWQPGVMTGDPLAAGVMPLRRLTASEYKNTVRELLHIEVADLDLPQDVSGSSGFSTPPLPAVVEVQQYMKAAEEAVRRVDVEKLFQCDVEGRGAPACTASFIETWGAEAFRRPLTQREKDQFGELVARFSGELGLGYSDTLLALTEAILQSPGFLYHWQLGPVAPGVDAEGRIPLNGWEIASRLSYLIWRSMPDQELFRAARDGELETREGIEGQTIRLLNDSKAGAAAEEFFRELLEVPLSFAPKSADAYSNFSASAQAALQEEFSLLSRDLTRLPGNGVERFFLSTAGYSNASLLSIYGVGEGKDMAAVDLGPARPGLLTRGAFLAATSNAYEGDPTKRGSIVRRRLLCQPLRPAPPGVPPLPPPQPNATVRERHEGHFDAPRCSGCHELTDAVGFGFSNFDAVGAYGTTEKGKAIDPSGRLVAVDGVDRDFADVGELMAQLGASTEVRGCFVRQFLRFATGRKESSADNYSLSTIWQQFEGSDFAFSELISSLSSSNAVRFRSVSKGETTR